MGVNGLWNVIQPCARPTNLATLNRKRLAVDASIWIYQFLKAVRDKEGNALRNSHVVGFFRRICKLLWFGIQPVFVFDGGAPALKRATIQGRKRRREGRRDDAVKTAGKLLAVQMRRLADEEDEKRKREAASGRRVETQPEEELPDINDLVYVDEIGMSKQERQQTRKFFKQDAYHLPELDGSIASMGKPEDPRIMSVEELEDYAQQFHSGEDINLYDFSKIDFDGDFFKSLPAADRYNILNAGRLRSRLRMGLSKEQLDDMFPDRMAFSKFQIDRVKERNNLTQRLMAEAGMTGIDLTIGGSARVAGERDREYILVKNEGAEGGWALGVVSKEKDIGEAHKPIDVDAIEIEYQSKDKADGELDEDQEDEDEDFEDIPIEGLNRLPKLSQSHTTQQQHNGGHDEVSARVEENAEGSLFIGGTPSDLIGPGVEAAASTHHPEEEDDINVAIAMSLQTQFNRESSLEVPEKEAENTLAKPEWTQRSVDVQKPINAKKGSMIAHIVNNRANASMAKRQENKVTSDSESEDDMQALITKSQKSRPTQKHNLQQIKAKPFFENKKNPFDGPLPFPKLDWGSSLFSKKQKSAGPEMAGQAGFQDSETLNNESGGFLPEADDDKPRPLPPWLVDDTDIRESVKKQLEADKEINTEDRLEAEQEEHLRKRQMRNELIEIDSSSDSEGDVEIVDKPASPEQIPEPVMIASESPPGKATAAQGADIRSDEPAQPAVDERDTSPQGLQEDYLDHDQRVATDSEVPDDSAIPAEDASPTGSPELEFEDIPVVLPEEAERDEDATDSKSEVPVDRQIDMSITNEETRPNNVDDDLFADVEYEEFSDSEDEELMVQMTEEAEEHARFASELNSKSAEQNREDYEKELRQLRTQQKKDRRDADEVTQVMITECQGLLRLFGIPYVTAPMEAEAQCAELVRLGLVDGIVTDDSDTFLFGGTRVYKNMFNSNKFVECYLGVDLEKELSLSRDQLISLAHLLGSDYTEGLPGVGPVTAVEILSEFPSQAGLVHFRDWWKDVQSQTRPKEADLVSPFRKKFRRSQETKLFLPTGFPNPAVYAAYLHPEVDSDSQPFQWGVPDVEGLRQFLMATIGWSKERTDEVLVPVIRDMNKRDAEGTQSNITRFFSGGVGVGAKEAFAPRQKAQGSKRMAVAVDRLKANTALGSSLPEQSSGSKRRKTAKE